jgi:hypothetical protein
VSIPFNRFIFLSATTLCAISCKNTDNQPSEATDNSTDKGGCGQECELQLLSPCTCGVDDPCGWNDDGLCDRDCLFENIVEVMFDDAKDCPGLCEGACAGGFYTACSCGTDDPCDWTEDALCDVDCLNNGAVNAMFDDSADCADAGL